MCNQRQGKTDALFMFKQGIQIEVARKRTTKGIFRIFIIDWDFRSARCDRTFKMTIKSCLFSFDTGLPIGISNGAGHSFEG